MENRQEQLLAGQEVIDALNELRHHLDDSLKRIGDTISDMEKRIADLETGLNKLSVNLPPSWDVQPRYLTTPGHSNFYDGSLLSLVPQDEQQDVYGSGRSSPDSEMYDSFSTYVKSMDSYRHSTRQISQKVGRYSSRKSKVYTF